jgi:6-phosphogluconolactonase
MKLIQYPDAELMAIDLANRLAGELTAALGHEDRVLFAVPGGTTPGPVFDALCAADLDWSRVDVVLTDERWVPEDDPRSNTRLVRQRLLTSRAAAAHLLPMRADTPEPEGGIDRLIARIAPRLPVGVLLLGMGADMHTASLFPGATGLAEALDPHAPAVLPIRAPGLAEARVTLAAHALDGALSKHLVITGADKRAALDRAMGLPPEEAPINAVLQGATVHWAAS